MLFIVQGGEQVLLLHEDDVFGLAGRSSEVKGRGSQHNRL